MKVLGFESAPVDGTIHDAGEPTLPPSWRKAPLLPTFLNPTGRRSPVN